MTSLRRPVQLIGTGATFLLTACLAQAVPLVPPWCQSQGPPNAALSSDGKWILTADESSHSLTLFNTALETVHRYKAATLDGKSDSRIGDVYDAPARRSFIVNLPDIAELWEVSYDPKAEPIYDGLVHDYRMGEGIAQPGYFGVRRTRLKTPLTDLYFTQDYRSVIGVAMPKATTTALYAHVINLDIRREIDNVLLSAPLDPDANLALTSSGKTWRAKPGARQKVAARKQLLRYCTP